MVGSSAWLWHALVLAALLGAAGCSGPGLPKTYSARGTVVYQGGQPMKGGTILFSSAGDPHLRVVAEVKDDGAFTLHTVKDNAQGAGAPAGEYQVTVQPPRPPHDPADLAAAKRPIPAVTLPDTYKIEPKENTLKIELPVPPPS